MTTHASLTMDLVLQLLGRHLHNGDAPMQEFVDEFRAARAGDLRSFRLREFSLRVPLDWEFCWAAAYIDVPTLSNRVPSTTRTSQFRVRQKGRLRAPHELVDRALDQGRRDRRHVPLVLTTWRSLGSLPPPLSLRERARFACPRRKAPQGATQSATKARRRRASWRRASFSEYS